MHDRTFHCRHFDIKYVHTVYKYSKIFAIKKEKKVLLIKKILRGCKHAHNGSQCLACIIDSALTDCAIGAILDVGHNF